MAKSPSKKSTHTHVPSHIGFSIIGLVALVFGVAVATQYNVSNQTQTVQSEAAGSTGVTATKQCISYNTSGKCLLYQSTTTKVNTSSPCVGYNTSGKCVQYQGTTQNTSTFVPTIAKPQTATKKPSPGPVVVNKSGPGLLACKNGQAVAVGGAAYNESRSQLAHICSLNKNTLFVGSTRYTCSNIPAAYKYLAASACK